MARTGNAELADDLLQASVERALRREALFDRSTSLHSWLFRIAQNLHIDSQRRTSRQAIHVDDQAFVDYEALTAIAGEDGVRTVEIRSELARAYRALQQLPAEQRDVFLLVVVDECTYGEASEILGIPVGTVMSRLARGRSKLAGYLRAPG